MLQIAILLDITRKFLKNILRIFGKIEANIGEFEIYETYFGRSQSSYKVRHVGLSGKTPVFGFLKRGGKVFTEIAKYFSKKHLAE